MLVAPISASKFLLHRHVLLSRVFIACLLILTSSLNLNFPFLCSVATFSMASMHDARLAGRLHKELKMLQDPPPGVCVWPADEHNLSRLEAQIQGPDGTVYSKGIFKLEVEIPDRYPFEPPNVKFITPVYHPNIDSGGRICHDILNMPPKGQWRPSLNIGAVLASIRVLLEEPNHDDGLMSDISAEYKHNRALFDDKARRSTERYALQNGAERDTVLSRDIDQVKASVSLSPPTVNQIVDTSNHDKLARPVLKEVNRTCAPKVSLEEARTSNPGAAASSFTQPRPRSSFAAKLSLAKGNTSQEGRSCSVGGAAQVEPVGSLSFNMEKEIARETEVLCRPGSENIPQPSELNGSFVVDAGMEASHESEDIVVEVGGETSTGKDADNSDRNDPAICNTTKEEQLKTQTSASQSRETTISPEKGKKLTLPKSKLLKLSRPQPVGSQSFQESTQNGRVHQNQSHSKRAAQVLKEPVILLDSESDDDDLRVQGHSEGLKRKFGRS